MSACDPPPPDDPNDEAQAAAEGRRRRVAVERLVCCGRPLTPHGRVPRTPSATRTLILLCEVCHHGAEVVSAEYRPFRWRDS